MRHEPLSQREQRALGFPGLNRLWIMRVAYALAAVGALLRAPAYFAGDDVLPDLATVGFYCLGLALAIGCLRASAYGLLELEPDDSADDLLLLVGALFFVILGGVGLVVLAGLVRCAL